VRLEDPPGLSPITTVGRFATAEAAKAATGGVGGAVTHADQGVISARGIAADDL
jgi:hypothetical protein